MLLSIATYSNFFLITRRVTAFSWLVFSPREHIISVPAGNHLSQLSHLFGGLYPPHEELDRNGAARPSLPPVPSPPDKKAGRGQSERKCSALHVWTNFSVSGCLGSSSGNLNERLAWSSSSKLWSRGPLGTDRSGPWRWLLQEKPPPQARSLRMCTWLSLRGQWSLREKREVVDR